MKYTFTLIVACLAYFSNAQADSTKVHADSLETVLINLSSDDLEQDAQNQDISNLLQSSRDVFLSQAGYNFSGARYRVRGYSTDQYTVMMNGVRMNQAETGYAIYSLWGGLNDVTRYPEVKNGISSNDYTFGSIAGYSNKDLRASAYRKGSRFSYAIANRAYRHRIMLTHSTGMMANGWAITASASARWSQEGYVEGTYYSAASYFLSIEKKINDKHSIGLSGFGANTVTGRAGIARQDVYDLTSNNYYNPYWGYQTSEITGEQQKRNSRVRTTHVPSVFLTHYWTINKQSSLTTSLYGSYGKYGNTALNWYDAKNPRPDYYKYLPAYYEQDYPTTAAQLTNQWTSNDPSVTQVNWDAFYNANRKNLYYQEDVDGVAGNNLEFNRSKYIVQEYRSDPLRYGINSVYKKKFENSLNVVAGLNVDQYVSHNFKVIDDLLGGDYWVDIDQFAEQTYSDPDRVQSNIDTPNRLVKEGDKFGYNYDMHINNQRVFGQVDQWGKKVDWYAGLELSHTVFYRDGLWANGKFPENSKGKSDKANFFNYGVKAGAVYKVTGRHFITGNALYQTRAPFAKNSFISAETRNDLVPNLKSTEIMSGDLNYEVRYPNFRSRATVYFSQVNNQTTSRLYYHDEYKNFVNYIMTGVNQQYTGVELGLEGTLANVIVVNGAFSTGQFIYTSRPNATVSVRNSAELLDENRTVYLKNYKIGGMPQTAASIGIKYNSPKYWFIGLSFNWFTNIYLDPNPDRRTEAAVSKYIESDPQWGEVLDQEVIHDLDHNKFFDNNYTVNGYAGVSFKIKETYLRLNATVNNIFNNKSFCTGGYEQLRYDSSNINKFPPKYGYMYGTQYFIMLTYQF